MTQADWELIQMARARRMADCFEAAALQAARDAGHETMPGQFGYALSWLALRCADRIVKLEAARAVPDPPAQGTAAPSPLVTAGGGVSDLADARKSRR